MKKRTLFLGLMILCLASYSWSEEVSLSKYDHLSLTPYTGSMQYTIELGEFKDIDFDGLTIKKQDGTFIARVDFKGFENLLIWTRPDAPYVCIEPWSSLPAYDGKIDDIETKYEMTALEPNETKVSGFDIIIG